MPDHDPAKRVPKSLGTDPRLFGRYTLSDLAVALLPGVLVLLLLQVVLPASVRVAGYRVQALTLPLVGAAVLLGALSVSLTPAHTSSLDWLGTALGYYRRPRRLAHEPAKPSIRLERVHPEWDVLERTDGALLAVLQVHPPNLALATDAEWTRQAEAFQDVLNTVLTFPVQFYATTRSFPVEAYLAQYEARLDDPDVAANPQLAALIEAYVDWYADDLEQRRTTIRDHYVLLPVTPAEVQFERSGLAHALASLPLFGFLVRAWFGPAEAELLAAMLEAVDERARRTRDGLRGIDGCDVRRVDAVEAARLVAAYWQGAAVDEHALELRTRPLVGEAS